MCHLAIVHIKREQERLRVIDTRLRRRYRNHLHYNFEEPLTELLFILLSIQTGEVVYRKIFRALRHRYPGWNGLPNRPNKRLLKLLRPAGLSNKRADRLIRIVRSVRERFGKKGLRALAALPDKDVEEYLVSLPGVGTKIARCVMLYSYHRQKFPVDIHVWRIMSRLGFAPGGRLYAREEDRLEHLVPPGRRLSLHVNLVSLGRDICKKRPECDRCLLLDLCPTGVRLT